MITSSGVPEGQMVNHMLEIRPTQDDCKLGRLSINLDGFSDETLSINYSCESCNLLDIAFWKIREKYPEKSRNLQI